MFRKFAEFWIKNRKLTITMILVTLLIWMFSRFTLPKQFNPDIKAPAFYIVLPAPWYSTEEVKEFLIKPLQNKLTEIKWIEHIYWYANKWIWTIMVTFFVWENKEITTTRLYNKIFSNKDLIPKWMQEPIIKPIDVNELPIFSFAITSNKTWTTKNQLRQLWIFVIDKLKEIDDIRWFFLVWWDKSDITINTDLKKMEAKHIALMQIYQVLEKNNISLPVGNIKFKENSSNIYFDWKLHTVNDIKNLTISYYDWKPVFIWDIANVFQWEPEEKYTTVIWEKWKLKNTVFVWISKKTWKNAINVINKINKKLKEIKKTLPDNYKFTVIQDEWKISQNATNSLLINLIESIFIVLIVLTIILWFKNAINVAITIPLTLSVVFLFALITWDNINKITLFALILVLGMLVDDATVVVENINRHIKEIDKTWLSKMQAVFQAIKEVEMWVVLSTVTRLLAFGSMFFVTWMMWSYMEPIPKYAIVAMIVSTLVALSINPFLTLILNRKKTESDHYLRNLFYKNVIYPIFHHWKKLSRKIMENKNIKNIHWKVKEKISNKKIWNFEKKYKNFISFFLNNKKSRKLFKLSFWILLFWILIFPSAVNIIKFRMLPKSNQWQIYLRADLSRDSSFYKTKEFVNDLNKFLKQYYVKWNNKKIKWMNIIKNVSTRWWIAPTPDFANLFRRIWERYKPYNVSLRINLIDKTKRKLTSEKYTILLRKNLEKFINEKYPDVFFRLLEDPPWPPVQATFMLKIQWWTNETNKNLEQLSLRLYKKLFFALKNEKVIDTNISNSKYQTEYIVKINHEIASKLWVDSETIAYTLRILFEWMNVELYHDAKAKEPINILLTTTPVQKYNLKIFNDILIPTKKWSFVPLKDISTIIPHRKESEIFFDDKEQTTYIYWEMWDNSVVYPVLNLYKIFSEKKFREWKFDLIEKNFYWFKIKEKQTGKIYKIKLWWEWKLTMDTFRDLWLAMFLAFLTIYFVMVWKFKSFKTWWTIMLAFLFWFFGVMPLFAVMYLTNNQYFSATSMIWVIALAWIVVWNSILLIEYITILVKKWVDLKESILQAWYIRMKPIMITSLTTIFWALTILWDPVRSWLSLSIIWWLIASAILTPIILPIFLYDSLKNNNELFDDNFHEKWI